MGVLCAVAENSGLKKKEKKRTAVKLKASDFVGLPNNSDGVSIIFTTGAAIDAVLFCAVNERTCAVHCTHGRQ